MKKETKPEKRVVKSYKIKLSAYAKADKKAKSKSSTVANVIEDFLYDYISR
jgi:hypothetical protein